VSSHAENKERNDGIISTSDVIRQLRATQLKGTMKKPLVRNKHTSLHVTQSPTHFPAQKHPHHHQQNSERDSDNLRQSVGNKVGSNNVSSNKRPAEQPLLISKRHRSEDKSDIPTCADFNAENEIASMSKIKASAKVSNDEHTTDTTRKSIKMSPYLRDIQRHKQVTAARRRISEAQKKEKEEDEEENFPLKEQQRRKTVTHPLLEALVQHNRRIHSLPSRDVWKTSTLNAFKPTPSLFIFQHTTQSQHSIVTTAQHITNSQPQKDNQQSSGTLENPVELPSESEGESEKEKETPSGDCSGPATPSSSPRSGTNTPTPSFSVITTTTHTHSSVVVPLLTLNENEVLPLKRTLSHGALITLRLIAFQSPTQSVLLPLTSQHSDFRLLQTCFRFRTSPFGTPEEIALCHVHSIKVSTLCCIRLSVCLFSCSLGHFTVFHIVVH
jgi:hypothetical protein